MENLRPIKGFPFYAVDVENREVYSYHKRKRKMALLKGRFVEMVHEDGRRRTVSMSRVLYAAGLRIDPSKIPSDVFVIETDKGVFQAVTNSEKTARENDARTSDQDSILRQLNRKKRETELLIDIMTGKCSVVELVRYADEIEARVIAYFRRHHTVDYVDAKLYFDRAVDFAVNRSLRGRLGWTFIFENLAFRMQKLFLEDLKEQRIQDEKEYQRITKQL